MKSAFLLAFAQALRLSATQDKNHGFQPGTQFQIKSRQDGNLVLAVQPDNSVQLAAPGGHLNEYWIFDADTQSIRSTTKSEYALSFDNSANGEKNLNVMLRPWTGNSE